MQLAFRARILAGVAGLALAATGARAYETQIGDYQISIDTTLSSQVAVRTSPQDPRFIGVINGGNFYLPNYDNGDLNFKQWDPVAAQQRVTTELQVKREDYGLFVRATGFYDPVIDSERQEPFPLSRAAVRDIGADLRLLDAYVFFHPVIGGHGFDVRIGNQALNWGESTFIQFGINSINPLDVTALRTPGSELRNGFLPIPAVDVRTELGGNFSLEGFWQPIWTRDRLEPVGSFFGTNDTLFDGGRYGLLFSFLPDAYRSVYAANLARNVAFGGAYPRSTDRHPTGLGEFGFALRKTVPELGDAEFGLYFENYYSRTPFGSYRTGIRNVSAGALGLPNTQVLPDPFTSLLGPTIEYARNTYDATSSFFADYPKDIHLIGASFNFNAPGGWAIQGEYSNRLNQPLQLSASDLALITDSPAICTLSQSAVTTPFVNAACAAAKANPVTQIEGGIPGFQQIVTGWKRYPVSQFQVTATKLYNNPAPYVNSLILVGEIGFDYIHDFPRERGVLDAYASTDTNSAFTRFGTVNQSAPLATKGLVTQFSGAYTLQVIVDMPNVLPYGIGMKPQIALQHDFVGTSAVGANVWQENTAAVSVGATFSYLQAWNLNVQYTNHFPVFDGGKFYGLIDRDFVSAALSYSF